MDTQPAERGEQLLDRREVASVFDVPLSTIDRMCRDGEIPLPLRIGTAARWRSSDLFACIDKLTTQIVNPAQGSTLPR